MAEKVFKDVEIYSISRGNNSYYGNPRYKLQTSLGVFRTGVDSSLAFGIENYTNARHPETHVIGNPGVTVDLVARQGNPRDNVYGIRRNGELLK